MSSTNVQAKTQATQCQINMATKDQDKLTSIKCVANPQHSTPDKNCGYDNANIAEELHFCSSEQ